MNDYPEFAGSYLKEYTQEHPVIAAKVGNSPNYTDNWEHSHGN
jgi:hypothetical protein